MSRFLCLLCLAFTCLISSCTSNKDADQKLPYQVTKELDLQLKLGEGAFWKSETQELFFVDIIMQKLHVYSPETNKHKIFDLPSRIGTVVPCKDNLAVVALEDGMYLINTDNGSLELLVHIEKEIKQNRFNDGKCSPDGTLWVGSMHLRTKDPTAKLYKVNRQGEYEAMLKDITISNGIVWSKDGKTMFYIDTPTQEIKAFDYHVNDATISNERVLVKVDQSLGSPDGMAIDEYDNLWVGMWNGNAIICFDGQSGEVLKKITIPAHNVTSCAFGGPNLDTLYITSAFVDMTEAEEKEFPSAGAIFKCVPGVRGVRNSLFR